MVAGKQTGCMVERAFRNKIFLAKYNKAQSNSLSETDNRNINFEKETFQSFFYDHVVTISDLKQIKPGAKGDMSN